MSVVRRQARLRWLAVGCGIALLCGLPAIIASWPVPQSSVSPGTLRARILASAGVAYSGYVESSVDFNLPTNLPDLGDLTTLLDGITDQYTWYLSPGQWRSDVITSDGEDDTYQTSHGTYLWNYSRNLMVQVTGSQPFRLPQASDLLPPALARRLLSYASPADHISRLPSQRMAGVDAAGLRLLPVGRTTTVGPIEIWANPVTGLPLEVTITGRGATKPILVSRFLDLNQSPPSSSTVTPNPAAGVGYTTTQLPNVRQFLNGFGPSLPSTLAGQRRIANPGGLADVAAYGTGFARFAVITLPHATGDHLVDGSDAVGAGEVSLPGHPFTAVITSPLLNVLVAQPLDHGGPVYMFTGTVKTSVLVNAATTLLTELQEQAP